MSYPHPALQQQQQQQQINQQQQQQQQQQLQLPQGPYTGERECHLILRQQPKQSRMCGYGEKGRIPYKENTITEQEI